MTRNNNQDLKRLFHNPQLPDIDLTEKVMKRIYAEQQPKRRFMVKYRISFVIVAALLLTASTAVAMVQYNFIKNKQGEVVYQTKPLSESDFQIPSKEESMRTGTSERLKQELLPKGSAAYFYVVPHNPNKELDLKFTPFTYTDIADLRAGMKDKSIPIVDSLNETLKFRIAEVFYAPEVLSNPPTPEEKAEIAERLLKQAELAKKDYAMMPLKFSDQLLHMRTTFSHRDKVIEVTIREHNKDDDVIPATYWDEDIKMKQEVLTVNGVELLYIKFEQSGSSLIWVDDTSDSEHQYVYEISAVSGKTTKEELVEMAQLYMK
ncbi:hypothetical protein NQ117_12485 [Paenibacillus sp. SC116]|uniref:hypothetical protein n=1 Tax=Paenibacillus sp. SC116 TaxID=2968986 RepID=UPI00215B7092|nr:hypothetical protein [Paenibacillus sp. SC116]MCR8844502.1 hypothetical protein [Paenibacillus sp. SC116]